MASKNLAVFQGLDYEGERCKSWEYRHLRKKLNGGLISEFEMDWGRDLLFPSKDGRLLIIGNSQSGSVRIFDFARNAIISELSTNQIITDIWAENRNHKLVVADQNGDVTIWPNWNNKNESKTIQLHDGAVTQILFIPSRNEFVSCGEDGHIRFWDDKFETVLAELNHTSILPCLLYTSPSPRDRQKSRMPSSA